MKVYVSVKKRLNIRWPLMVYDLAIMTVSHLFLLYLYQGPEKLTLWETGCYLGIFAVCIFSARLIGRIYRQIWRYGGIQCYIRLLLTDAVALPVVVLATRVLARTTGLQSVSFARAVAVVCLNLLCSLAVRMVYRYAYKYAEDGSIHGKTLRMLLRIFAGPNVRGEKEDTVDSRKIKIAIIGAGHVGVNLAGELLNSHHAAYVPVCFIDRKKEKAGREIHGIPVLFADGNEAATLEAYQVQEVVFAIPDLEQEDRERIYEKYLQMGYKIKAYDYPIMESMGKKAQIREFDIEDLLFRKSITINSEKTDGYYRDKVVLVTGGGGSIGSELCRQIAKMAPKKLIILDIGENGAYEVQQELKMAHGDGLSLQVEIASVTNLSAVDKIFESYRPQIVVHAAAHKHVPLMEHNCVEAVINNVFGTANLVEMCEKYGTERFMLVSTDKAVNPTNVMGATKRLCEMIVLSASQNGRTKYSATRFGNVLGSAGSVIPLFKRQIAAGGPITVTDKRIVRYFMTIPEATQLVLESGAMAKNGELFVLDMGLPVKIWDLACNMVRLSGAHGIEIVETGLIPGEKLYEELLINTDTLIRTENSLIFIERDEGYTAEELHVLLNKLKAVCEQEDNELTKAVLKEVVPT